MTPSERELRDATVTLILSAFRKQGEYTCTKVRARRETSSDDRIPHPITGYVTLLKNVVGKTPRELEPQLGLASGALRNGAEVLLVSSELSSDQIGPRYTTAWSAGASPRDLDNHQASYHSSYPAASDPIFQCVIYRNKPAEGRLIRILGYDQPMVWP
jgi:hypothetical protein